MSDDRETGVFHKCEGCGAKVMLLKNVSGNAYYACNGKYDEAMCNTNCRFGAIPSRRLLKGAKDAPAPAPKPAADPPKPADSGRPAPASGGDGKPAVDAGGFFARRRKN